MKASSLVAALPGALLGPLLLVVSPPAAAVAFSPPPRRGAPSALLGRLQHHVLVPSTPPSTSSRLRSSVVSTSARRRGGVVLSLSSDNKGEQEQEQEQQQQQQRQKVGEGKSSEGDDAPPAPPPPTLFATPEGAAASAAASSLAEQARRAALEAERMEAELTLTRIGKLEAQLKKAAGGGGEGSGEGEGEGEGERGSEKEKEKEKVGLREEIEALAKKIDPSLVAGSSAEATAGGTTAAATAAATAASAAPLPPSTPPPAGLTAAELDRACEYYTSLPITMRSTLARAVGYERDYLTGLEIRDVLTKLYERRDTFSTAKLRENYKESLVPPLTLDGGVEELFDEFKNMLENPDEMRLEAAVDTQIPRQVRREGKCPTEADVNVFFTGACGRDTFQPAEKPIRAGEVLVVRGKNRLKDAASLVDAVDGALEKADPTWSERNQWCYVMDPSLEEGEEDLFGDPVVLIANRDMAPAASGFLTTASTLTALSGAFLFCLGTYGSNPVIMERLQLANEAGNYDLSWFNELIFPLLTAFAAIQASHELAHLAVAWRDKMKVAPPTILPSLGLPYLSFLSRMKTSPKDYRSLFDFGFVGPVAGMGVSFGFLLLGLQLTASLDQEAIKYLPSLPVGFVRLSSLGGTLVDQFVGGGQGILLNQDPATMVPLHPFAVAGFVSMMINALDLIPIGSTDGARMSQSILGRVGQTVVGGFAYIVLLFALIFLDQRDIFLSYCLVNTLVQRDLEVPCQNEVDRVELGRAAAALAAWFVAALVVIPMT